MQNSHRLKEAFDLYPFSIFSQKNEEKSLNIFCSLHLSVQQVQRPLEGLSFVKTLATFGIINATDSQVQHITRIHLVCLC